MIGGSLIDKPVEGNICMFAYGQIEGDENIFWNIPLDVIIKKPNEMDIME